MPLGIGCGLPTISKIDRHPYHIDFYTYAYAAKALNKILSLILIFFKIATCSRDGPPKGIEEVFYL